MRSAKKTLFSIAYASCVFGFVSSLMTSTGSVLCSAILERSEDHLSVVPTTCFGLLMKKGLRKKFQLISGSCWAFAAISALETAMCKNGILSGSLSEKHLLNWANRNDHEEGYHVKIEEGVDSFSVPAGYFISGSGPVYEKDKHYSLIDEEFSTFDKNMLPVCTVKGIAEIENNVDTVKNAIDKYGAIYAHYKSDDGRHAVSVIGWNDSKKVWLVKDSFDSSKNYYKTLPYSTVLDECTAFTDVRKYKPCEKIYQHDLYGNMGLFSQKDNLTACNIFSFGENESLKEITLGTNAEGCVYRIYYTSSFLGNKPSSDKSKWQSLASGTVPYSGYFTAKLDAPAKILSGKGSIIVSIERDASRKECSSPCIKVVGKDDALSFTEKNDKSYILLGNDFVDVTCHDSKKYYGTVGAFSIKAVTEKNK